MERSRRAIWDAALSLSLSREQGFHALMLALIVRRAGLNRATFHAHFPDKQAVIGKELARLLRGVSRAIRRWPCVLRMGQCKGWSCSSGRNCITGFRAFAGDAGHEAGRDLMGQNIASAFLVATAHTLAMTIAGALIAVAICFHFGLKFLSRTWFNLDVVWASSLILVGAFGIYFALHGH